MVAVVSHVGNVAGLFYCRAVNGPENGLCRPKHVAPLNLNKLNKLHVLDVKCLSFNINY